VRLGPGTRVGPYEVVATLGSGGMAEVYRARDSRLQREVADDGNTLLMNEYGRAPGLQSFTYLWDRRQSISARLGKGYPIALSHDGRWALFEEEPYVGRLVLLPTGAGAPRVLGESGLAHVYSASFFGDGRRVALIGRKRP